MLLEYIIKQKGTNKKGEPTNYVIKSHKTNKIIGHYKTRGAAGFALSQMNEDIAIVIESEDMYRGVHLSNAEKDISLVKKKMVKNNKVIGMPANAWEENVIKKQYPAFYKTRVAKKVGHDKNGLPINPFVFLPRSS